MNNLLLDRLFPPTGADAGLGFGGRKIKRALGVPPSVFRVAPLAGPAVILMYCWKNHYFAGTCKQLKQLRWLAWIGWRMRLC